MVINLKDSHTHESDPPGCKAKEVVNQIKQKSESLTPTVAIASEISVFSDDYPIQPSWPKKKLIGTACLKRQRENRIDAPTPIDRHFDIPEEFKIFLLKNSGNNDSERILMFGEMNLEKDSNMQKIIYLQETTGIVCSKRPRYEKIKKQMQFIQSGYTFENVLPHLRAVANFR